MRLLRKFFALPTSLLLLLTTSPHAQAITDRQSLAQWPYNLPPQVKYWPEDPPHRRRGLEAVQEHIRAGHTPVRMKKMSEDESEMFFPEYWGFREQENQVAIFGNGWRDSEAGKSLRKDFEEEEARLMVNASAPLSFRPPFAFHTNEENTSSQPNPQGIAIGGEKGGGRAAALALLEKRAFQCPTGTSSCGNIAPNLCCATGETCISIPDTGLGPIGCCPDGATCGGTITCVAGNTPCASDIGGGCCIPGYVCAGLGCIPAAVTTVSTITSLVASTTIIPTSLAAATTRTSSSALTDTDTGLQTTATCGCGYQACPVNLGGGCCPSGRVCTTGILCPLPPGATTDSPLPSSCILTSTATASAPIRQTSDTTSTPPTTSATAADGSCPTGFYACSAYYAGGACCRTGRDCATTDCPITTSTTIVSSGVTIEVPLTGAAITTASGSCMMGWYSCSASQGGDCCPSGWDCGLQSCTSVGPTNTVSEPKEGVIASAGIRLVKSPIWFLSLIGLMICIEMVG